MIKFERAFQVLFGLGIVLLVVQVQVSDEVLTEGPWGLAGIVVMIVSTIAMFIAGLMAKKYIASTVYALVGLVLIAVLLSA